MALDTLPVPGPLALRMIKALVWLLCLAPALNLALGWQADTLGANPVETLTRTSGAWTLRLLLITLALTPLRRLSGRAERMAYIVAVCDSEGDAAGADLHMAWLNGWTADQAKAAEVAAGMPAKGRV